MHNIFLTVLIKAFYYLGNSTTITFIIFFLIKKFSSLRYNSKFSILHFFGLSQNPPADDVFLLTCSAVNKDDLCALEFFFSMQDFVNIVYLSLFWIFFPYIGYFNNKMYVYNPSLNDFSFVNRLRLGLRQQAMWPMLSKSLFSRKGRSSQDIFQAQMR